MLKNGWSLFSKKQNDDTGEWWVMINKPIIVSIGFTDIPADSRTRGDGVSLADALTDAFTKVGIAGLPWLLVRLDVRVRALRELIAGPERKPLEKACPHGNRGGRCRQCV